MKTEFASLTSDGKLVGAISIDLDQILNDDPLAYAYGFAQGYRGEERSSEKDLAPAYVDGHDHGKAVHDKTLPMPAWAEKRD